MKTKLASLIKAAQTYDELTRWESGNLRVGIRRITLVPPGGAYDFMVIIRSPEKYPDEVSKLKKYLTKFSTIKEVFLDEADEGNQKLHIKMQSNSDSALRKALNAKNEYSKELRDQLHGLGFAGVHITTPFYVSSGQFRRSNSLVFSCHSLPDNMSEDGPRTKELINEIERITGIHYEGSSYIMGDLNLNFSLKIDGTTNLLTRIYELEETL